MINLPNIRQTTDYTCGAAALLSVLNYYGLYDDSEMELAEELETDSEWGTDPVNIVCIAKKYGLEAYEFKGMSLEQLEGFVKSGTPVIVAYQAWSESELDWPMCWEDGHYSVAIGCDQNNIYFEDPSLGAGEIGVIEKKEFMRRWHDVDHNCEPLYQYGLALSYSDHPFYNSPINRIRKIE